MRLIAQRFAVASVLFYADPAAAVNNGTDPDPRCITIKDVVIVAGAEAWADKKLCKSPGSIRYDVIEVAAAVYGAATTQEAFEKASNQQLRELRTQIETLRTQIASAGNEDDASRVALLEAQSRFVAQLARKDPTYADAIQQFRESVADIAATPGGLAALAQYNAGDGAGALAALDRLRVANDAVRKDRSTIASAVEGRRIAKLALDAHDRGQITIAKVIARYENVVKLDSGVFSDWYTLSWLYQITGRLRDATGAVMHAKATAQSELDRGKWLVALGNIMNVQHNLAGAENAYAESLQIVRKLAAADPGNPEAQRGIAVNLINLGSIRQRRGDLAGADRAYAESLADFRQLAAADPNNVRMQSYVAAVLGNIGVLRIATHDFNGAHKALTESFNIDQKLAAADPSNVNRQRYVAHRLFQIARLDGSGFRWREVVAELEAMNATGTLAPSDRRLLDQARANARRERPDIGGRG